MTDDDLFGTTAAEKQLLIADGWHWLETSLSWERGDERMDDTTACMWLRRRAEDRKDMKEVEDDGPDC